MQRNLMTGTADESGFADFLAAAADGRQTLLGDARDLDAIERADGEAFCAQVIETALQLVAVGFLICGEAGDAIVPVVTETGIALLWLSALLTLYTGWDYLQAGLHHLSQEDA